MTSPWAQLFNRHHVVVGDLVSRLREAEEAVRARDDFLATAAHELRSPLFALALQLEALERLAERGDTVAVAREVGRLRRSVDRYVRRATVLLDVTRLNADQAPLRCEPVDVRDLVRTVIDTYSDEARFRGCALTWDVACQAVGSWDHHMVEEVLCNLVSNAIKYGAGTPVALCARLEGPATVVFQVIDQGPGIAPEQCARIFEKFERLVTGSRRQSGFGLGLWIVGKMVLAHKGSIDVRPGDQGGSCFEVRLPLRPLDPAAPPTGEPVS